MRYLFLTLLALLTVSSFSIRAHALTVSPAKIELTGDPGQTLQGEIDLFNEQQDPKTFFSSFENFEPKGDSGAPYFIGAADGLATWIAAEPSLTLAPGERKTVAYSISIPASAAPGGYFAAVFFGSQPPVNEGGGEVSIGGKVGVLVLLRVAGEVAEGGGLVDFGGAKRLWTSLPVTLDYRINNTGGDRIVPRGDMTIRNTFRMKAEKIPANVKEGSVLPGSTRKFEVAWRGSETSVASGFLATVQSQWHDFRFGWYTAELDLEWGQSNQTASAAYHFFIIPWQILIFILAGIVIITFIVKAGLRRYKRQILAQALRNQ